jgi:hypothetical protein
MLSYEVACAILWEYNRSNGLQPGTGKKDQVYLTLLNEYLLLQNAGDLRDIDSALLGGFITILRKGFRGRPAVPLPEVRYPA